MEHKTKQNKKTLLGTLSSGHKEAPVGEVKMTRSQLSLEFVVASNLHQRLRKADFLNREKTRYDLLSYLEGMHSMSKTRVERVL